MMRKRLADMSFGEFQKRLVQLAMDEIDEMAITPLLYFPLVLERVEAFLLAHWSTVWEHCSQLDWEQWLNSQCYSLFQGEVLHDIKKEVTQLEKNSKVS